MESLPLLRRHAPDDEQRADHEGHGDDEGDHRGEDAAEQVAQSAGHDEGHKGHRRDGDGIGQLGGHMVDVVAPWAAGASIYGLANMIIAPLIAGPLVDKTGPKVTFGIAIILFVLAAVWKIVKVIVFMYRNRTWSLAGSLHSLQEAVYERQSEKQYPEYYGAASLEDGADAGSGRKVNEKKNDA